MKEPSTCSFSRLWLKFNVWGTFYLLLLSSLSAVAQVTSAPCNTFAPLATPTFGNLTVNSSQRPVVGGDEFSNKNRLTDNDLTNAANFDFLIGGSAWIEVKDNGATGQNVYPSGSFAGFVIDNDAIALLGTSTITTYLGDDQQEEFPTNSLVSIGVATGRSRVGFITTKTFDRVRFTFTAIGAGDIDVYYAVVQRFCANQNPALACNNPTVLNSPTFPVTANTTFSGLNVATVTDPEAAISTSTTDFTRVTLLVGAGGASATYSVKNQVSDYDPAASPTEAFSAGFDIASPNLLNVGVLSGYTVATYLDGVATGESATGNSLITANTSVLSGTGRRIIGLRATKKFDEVRLIISGVNVLNNTDIYGAIVERFCPGIPLVCNTLTPINRPVQPVYVNGANTGVDGLACVGCGLNNTENAVDTDPNNFAQIVLAAGVATSANFAVANALDTYPASSFAGFDIEVGNLLSANVLSRARITLLNNGQVVQEVDNTTNSLLIGATSSLLNGRNRQIVGVIANVPYDEVKITFDQLIGADLGTINIYGTVGQRNCPVTIACSTTYSLNTPAFPVVINSQRTGVDGVAGVATTIRDPYNVISASTTDFARITNTAGVAANASISVLDAVNTFPTGTFAGFTIKRVSGLVLADLFSRLTVTTYLDGTQQEVRTGGGLLDLVIALFGSSTDFINVGFTTTKPFDEVRLSVAPLVGLDVLGGAIDVYGAFINTNTSSGGGLVCFVDAKPDFNVTNKNQPVSGNVSTNDKVATGTTYGQPVSVTQPAGATPNLTFNSDGTYTFNTSTPGVYVYNVPVCAPGQSSNCPPQPLTITVLDPAVNTNPPVANTDIAATVGPNPVTVNVKANDGPGNPGGTLGTPTIATPPANGSATVNGDGNVVYTPNPGFVGTDQLTYQVCEQPGGQCATATVSVTVKAQGSANTTLAADDYVSTAPGVAVAGNVKTNDTDPEGNAQTVTAQNTTVAGKGTFVLNADGSFTFTPVANFTGPVDFTYVTCDNGTPQACANGTLHVLVSEQVKPDLTPSINLPQGNFTSTGPNSERNFTVEIYELKGRQTSSGNVVFTITAPFGYSISYNASLTTIDVSGGGNTQVENTKWAVTSENGLQLSLTIKDGQFIPANGVAVIGFTIKRTIANANTSANITVNVSDDATQTYDSNPANNIFARVINALSN